ncbi:MAG: DinB-like domain protein [Gemmatimonadetes bacterium]|nr:DinB-like domain protein [Gemmatimonadota bacterium]
MSSIKLTLAVAVAFAAPLGAQVQASADNTPVMDAKSATHLRDTYMNDLDTVHVKILALAKAMPADKYSWRPGAGVRSISEALMHVASEWYVFSPMSVAGTPPEDFLPKTSTPAERRTAMGVKLQSMEKTTGKDAVIAELDKSWAYCKTQLMAANPSELTGKYKPWGLPLDEAAFGMAGDMHEHLGQLIAYARSVGVKPPWSK